VALRRDLALGGWACTNGWGLLLLAFCGRVEDLKP